MIERDSQVTEALGRLRPAMQADGGDVDLVAIEGGTVKVRLRGTCLACPSASLTLRHGIERALKEQLPWVADVVRIP
jgi:Fe-S cluster biogenesis protein NfuA